MNFKRSVRLTSKSFDEKLKLFVYDFTDNETNYPFTIYSTKQNENYEKLTPYQLSDCNFSLVLTKVFGQNGMSRIAWKVKGA